MFSLKEAMATADLMLWLAIGAGVALSLALAEKLTKRSGFVSVVSGVFCAVLFPGPILYYLQLTDQMYERALSGLFALTGNYVVRRAVGFAKSGTVSDLKKGLGK